MRKRKTYKYKSYVIIPKSIKEDGVITFKWEVVSELPGIKGYCLFVGDTLKECKEYINERIGSDWIRE